MKRTVTTCMLCGCLAIGSAFAQTTQKPDVNRVSFGVKGGYNYLLLSDRTQFATGINPSIGAFFEITANPFWGAGIEYLYMANDQTLKADDSEFESALHGITYYNSINITNLVAKDRSKGWQKFQVYGNLGGGVGLFKKPEDFDKAPVQLSVVGGLVMEYNMAKWFALGLESQYRYNPDVRFMPVYTGSANLCNLNLTARFKLGGDKNVRNMSVAEYYPKPVQTAPDNSATINQLKQRIAELDNTVANQGEDIQTLQQKIKDLQNKAAQRPADNTPVSVPTVPNVGFSSNSYSFTSASNPTLNSLAMQLQQNTTWRAEIDGHADATGNDAINIPLSKRRAEAVKTYLVKNGAPASAITTQGFGSSRPIAPNNTREGRAQNRRVEIRVIK